MAMTEPEQAPSETSFGHALGVIQRVLDGLTSALNVLGTLLILALMLLLSADIGGRVLFNSPISGVPELVSLSIVCIVFLQIAQAMRAGRLTRTEALLGWLGARAPWARGLVEAGYNLLAAGLIWILAQASLPLFLKAWNRDIYIGAVGNFTVPVWPVKGIILIGCAALILQFLFAAIRGLVDIIQPTDRKGGSR